MSSPCAGGRILTCGAASACCEGASGSSALGCTDTPGRTFAFVEGTTSFFSFDYPWGTVVVVTGAVSGTNPCKPGFGETIILGFALGMV